MDTSYILDSLNIAQCEAVSAPLGNMLILAGAGSGKTRVLVHRIAWLIAKENVTPWSIMAVTFTNKAAKELRERLDKLVGQSLSDMWVGTFHGLANRILRAHWQDAGLPSNFQVIDAEEQLRLIKKTQLSLNLNEADWPPRKAQIFINSHKDEGLRPQYVEHNGQVNRKVLIDIYKAYQTLCDNTGQVDFAELMLRSHEILRDQPALLQKYQTKFHHILVDEFQDTNTIQYAWLRLLAGERDNLFVVGDDDQAIYGWRGAKVENIQSLQRDRPNTKILRLEQNYRSTAAILKAANKLIANNDGRLGKTLWTDSKEGSPVQIQHTQNEVDEARFVSEHIRHIVKNGYNYADIAILYRTTAQSRLFEEALDNAQVPYRVYGGVRFFERAEIKVALAHLRLMINPHDDIAFERAATTPTRGIGDRTMEVVHELAKVNNCSLWQMAKDMPTGVLNSRSNNSLRAFVYLIQGIYRDIQGLGLTETVALVIASSGLPAYYQNAKDGSGPDRLENLVELVNVTRRFSQDYVNNEAADLNSFLDYATLESGEGQDSKVNNATQLMTLHAAKGLEFPLVFIVGMEEGLFPHQMSTRDSQRLEEERRLCYVGMTRAMQQLYMTYAQTRRIYGAAEINRPSRFLAEIQGLPSTEKRPKTVAGLSSVPLTKTVGGLKVGMLVVHPKFGDGIVQTLEGHGASARVQVNFKAVGNKWLVIAYANLRRVG